MDTRQWERMGAAAGVVFVALLLVTTFTTGTPPALDDPAREFEEYFRDNDGALKVAGYLQGLALVPFLWFLSSLWGTLRQADGSTNRLATVAAGAGVVTLTLAIVGTAVTSATAIRIDEVGAGGAQYFYLLSSMLFGFTAFGLATLLGATALVTLRTQVLPGWYGWSSAAIAVFGLIAGLGVTSDGDIVFLAFIAFLLFLVWVLVTSILLIRKVGTA